MLFFTIIFYYYPLLSITIIFSSTAADIITKLPFTIGITIAITKL